MKPLFVILTAALYNIRSDPGETVNRIAEHPEIAERLAKKIAEIRER